MYSRILGQSFFSVIKKIWWHRWHKAKNELKVLVLLNNSCATTLISLGTAWHKWYKHWLFGNYGLAQMYSACATHRPWTWYAPRCWSKYTPVLGLW